MINYIKGDATNPIGEGQKILVHCCNDIGAWGLGFVLALSKKWSKPEAEYRAWYKTGGMDLGKVQFVLVEPDITVANLIGQHQIGFSKDGMPPIRYEAIEEGLERIAQLAYAENASIHAPRFGAGLAGGDWSIIERLLIDAFEDLKIPVTIYDFE